MPDPHDNKDDDTVPIKPMMLTFSILFASGAGLIAGLLICWLFVCECECSNGDERPSLGAVVDVSHDSDQTDRDPAG
jgi:hypothetical protein